MVTPPIDEPRLDLRSAHVLGVDENVQGLDILGQILMGFGVPGLTRAGDVETFRKLAASETFDLILVEAGVGGNGYELVRWLRRESGEANRQCAVMLIAGHTPREQVETARDCGGNFVVLKPLSAAVLLRRILWLGRTPRAFIDSPAYVGPDRRFRNLGVPDGLKGRRRDDLSAVVGAAVDPNLSQSEIDTLMQPRKAVL